MGACGCGDDHATHRFPGPNGVVYTIGIYHGCEGCSNGPGVTLYRHEAEDDHWADGLPAIDFGDCFGTFPIEILNAEQMLKTGRAIAKAVAEDQAEDPEDYNVEFFPVEDMIDLRGMVFETQADRKREREEWEARRLKEDG